MKYINRHQRSTNLYTKYLHICQEVNEVPQILYRIKMMTQNKKAKGLELFVPNPIKIHYILNPLKSSSMALLPCHSENGERNKAHDFLY